jgi:hypothetical protein
MEQDVSVLLEKLNERIECAECGQDSAVPDGYEVAEV